MIENAAIILSSPRKGSNSSALALSMADGLKEAGVKVDIVDLSGLDIKPCLACESCLRNGGKCAQIDGMQTVYPKIAAADLLVLATPIYWFNMSGQLKVFLDRCYAVALGQETSFAKKTIAAALAYGDADPFAAGAVNAIRCFQDICFYTGARWASCLYASAMPRNTLAEDQELMAKAREFAKSIIKDV